MPEDRSKALSEYRINSAQETLKVSKECFEGKHYKDSINRAYYAAFYAIKAVLALEGTDFRRHKDVTAYFNRTYVAAEVFPKELGRKLSRLQQKREQSDYDDFFLASKEEAQEQLASAAAIVNAVKEFLAR